MTTNKHLTLQAVQAFGKQLREHNKSLTVKLSLSSSQRKIHNPIQLTGTMKVSISFYNVSEEYNNAPFQLYINR